MQVSCIANERDLKVPPSYCSGREPSTDLATVWCGLTPRSTGRAGTWLVVGRRRRGPPVSLSVRPHERRTMKCWLDFSGAPPLLIPTRLVRHWRGSFDRTTGQYSDLNTRAPHTDYDRACALAWPGRGIL